MRDPPPAAGESAPQVRARIEGGARICYPHRANRVDGRDTVPVRDGLPG